MNSIFYFRTLHEAGPELKRTISGNLDEQEVIYLLKTEAKPLCIADYCYLYQSLSFFKSIFIFLPLYIYLFILNMSYSYLVYFYTSSQHLYAKCQGKQKNGIKPSKYSKYINYVKCEAFLKWSTIYSLVIEIEVTEKNVLCIIGLFLECRA